MKTGKPLESGASWSGPLFCKRRSLSLHWPVDWDPYGSPAWPLTPRWPLASPLDSSRSPTHEGTLGGRGSSHCLSHTGYFSAGTLVIPEKSISDFWLVIQRGRWLSGGRVRLAGGVLGGGAWRCDSTGRGFLLAAGTGRCLWTVMGRECDRELESKLKPSGKPPERERRAEVRVTGREPSFGRARRSSVVILSRSESLFRTGMFRKISSSSVKLVFRTAHGKANKTLDVMHEIKRTGTDDALHTFELK